MAKQLSPSFRVRSIAILAVLILSACATVPKQESLDLEQVVARNGKALNELAEEDQAARIAVAQAQFVEDDGKVVLSNCDVADTNDCVVAYSIPGLPPRRLRAAAGNVRALHGSLERYASQMRILAEAEDLETVKAKAQTTAASVKALALVAGVPGGIVGAIVDGAVFLGNASLVEKRRRAMLRNALAARPVVKIAAEQIGPIARQMTRNVLEAKALEMKTIEQRNTDDAAEILRRLSLLRSGDVPDPATATRIEMLRERRSAGVARLVVLANDMNRLRRTSIPFGKAAYVHDLLIYTLENPKASTEDVLASVMVVENIIAEIVPPTQEQ